MEGIQNCVVLLRFNPRANLDPMRCEEGILMAQAFVMTPVFGYCGRVASSPRYQKVGSGCAEVPISVRTAQQDESCGRNGNRSEGQQESMGRERKYVGCAESSVAPASTECREADARF